MCLVTFKLVAFTYCKKWLYIYYEPTKLFQNDIHGFQIQHFKFVFKISGVEDLLIHNVLYSA